MLKGHYRGLCGALSLFLRMAVSGIVSLPVPK